MTAISTAVADRTHGSAFSDTVVLTWRNLKRIPRIPELAATGADYVSVGALTHSAPAMDLSFEIEPI